ncbi:ABC transporter substrate-binding protein [Paenibacillus crassostreae]|uniref:ABC transporter substrate-binding protein n=1 Tax=Paenibacillus crassostreae TaxID=1763538 RepID=A0A167EUC9_9BACL|nr:ABC transporter substrate-binding protein [Paenibacillus crassostreae]AOZ93458.1 ABC transporter substrate-binding protein [Paenibacillus crassostreae]OAB75887.1 ABC transporter substrate-binding protein [Paenibacillus crassostreae]
MKRKTPKTFAMLLIASALLISACGNSNTNNSGKTAESTGNSTSTNAVKEETNDISPITFTFFGADGSPNWNNMKDDVGQVITEKTGVTINAEYDMNNGGDDKISLMAASGDYPDIIFPKGNLTKLVDAEAMIDMTDLIEEHAPNLKKLYSQNLNRLKYSTADPAIYTIPTNGSVDQTSFDASGGFEIQHRVLKELGYPEIRTTVDFEKALKDYVALHPETDGVPTIPLLLNADDWKIMITVTNPAFTATGLSDDGEFYINPETYEAQLHYKRPEEKEYFRWLNHMYNEGLLDKDTFVQKDDQYQAKIASGRVLGLISQEWEYSNAENALKAAGKDEYTYGHFPVTISEDILDHSFQDIGFDGYGIGITTSCEDPVRAIKFLDWMASEEGQVLRNWGIEGKHYNVEDGVRVVPADVQDRKNNDNIAFTKESGIGLYFVFSGHYGDGVKDSTGNYYTTNFPEQIIANYSDVEKESLAAYNATTWKDLFPSKDEFPVKVWGAAYNMPAPSDPEYTVAYQKTQDIIRKRIPEAILAKPEKFDQIFDDMLAELDKVGAVQMEQKYTEYVQDRVKLWTGQ